MTDALPAIRLGELVRVHRALGLTGAVLIGFTSIDVLIALDFRSGEGRNAESIVSRLRLDEVRQRPIASDDSVTEVMLNAGFRTKSNFNRVFREAERCSPTEWRAAQRS